MGWGVMTSLKLHTCWMLCNMWGWGGWVGWGVMTSLKLATGLVTVMQSMATYRAARVNALGHSPANFLNLNNDSIWLYA